MDKRSREIKTWGANACRAAFEKRPGDLIRAYFARETARDFSDVMAFCAARRLAYHIRPAEELEKVTGSRHHEGVCFLMRAPAPVSLDRLLRSSRGGPEWIVGLEGVRNPHNIGAIARVAAHFGAAALVTDGPLEAGGGSIARTAQGAVERLPVVTIDRWPDALSRFRKRGYRVFATSGAAGRDLYGFRLAPRSLVLLGSESEGLSRAVLEQADAVLRVPGAGRVDSLNVSCAASAVLGEYWRRFGRRSGLTSRAPARRSPR